MRLGGRWMTGGRAPAEGYPATGSLSEMCFLIVVCCRVGCCISGKSFGTPRMFNAPHPPPSQRIRWTVDVGVLEK